MSKKTLCLFVQNLMSLCLKPLCLFVPQKLGNYILFAPLLLTPRPCRGRGGVSVFTRIQYLPCPSIFFLDITDPTPIPSPTRAGKQRILHLSEPHPICRSSHRPPTKKEGRTCLPNYILYVFMSFCPKPLCLFVQKPLCLFVQNLYVFLSKNLMSLCPKSKSPKSP